MIHVVVAEDSTTVRQLLVELLQSDPDIRVVGQATNGAEAVELVCRLRPTLVLMDVHMPVMDGLEATKEIMTRAPTPIVVVSSSASRQEIELSLSAMRVGALMLLPKPDNPQAPGFDGRREQLLQMVKAMSAVKVVRRFAARSRKPSDPAAWARAHRAQVRAVAVAASTGGPAAIQRLLMGLPRDFPAPILVVQHIAAGFMDGFARWLASSCDLHVGVARDRALLEPRTVYLAPDSAHLGVRSDGTAIVSDAPPVAGLRPSANFLFASAAQAFGVGLVAVVLTGMGQDGVEGLKQVRAAGGTVIAQDEASSVVFGMPGEAVRAGVVDAVLPVEDIADHLMAMVSGEGNARPDPRR